MLGLRMPLALALLAVVACGSDSADGETDTDGSTGADGDGGDSNFSRSASNNDGDGGGSLTFTGSPPGDDDGRDDDGNDSDPTDPDDSGGRDTDMATSTGTDTGGMATGGDTMGTGDTGNDNGDSSGLPDGGDCCEAQPGPGCGGTDVEDCVCMEDDFCCSTVWDVVCTVQVVTLGCGSCQGIGGGGDCCAPNGSPGCDDDAIEACVCDADFVCCTQEWDMLCVDAVTEQNCGACP